MRRTKVISIGIIVTFMVLTMTLPTFRINASTDAPQQTPINVACVFATGGLGDKSFNDLAYAGLQKAEADGLCTFTYAEPDEISEYQGLLENYASNSSIDLIVSIGFDQATAVNSTALTYNNTPIVLIDMVVVQGNVRSVVFNAAEGSFLVGAMAGLMTETGKIGFIGGMDIPLIREFWAGYAAGAIYENNNSYIEVVENFVGDWADPTTAKSMAEAMWADGVDIIFAAAGSSGLGVLESANEQTGKWAIGVDADQDYLYEGKILCSMMKRVDVAVYNAIKDVYNDEWTNDIQVLGLKDNGVGISPLTYTADTIGTEKIQEVNVTLRNKIISGELTVPTDEESLNTWLTTYGIVTKTAPASAPGFELLFVLGIFALLPIIKRRRR
ncbi:MAG: BMP family lipoprotein [Candidatus Hodarchaeales archaeon]